MEILAFDAFVNFTHVPPSITVAFVPVTLSVTGPLTYHVVSPLKLKFAAVANRLQSQVKTGASREAAGLAAATRSDLPSSADFTEIAASDRGRFRSGEAACALNRSSLLRSMCSAFPALGSAANSGFSSA